MVMKVIDEELVNGQTVLRSWTTTDQCAPLLVITHPGVGKPFWAWPTVPPGKIIGADFTNAPIATASLDTNDALIKAITTKPEDVLIYAPAS